ncbi:MAG: site-2 protease family protein [Chlamydiales bacterium]|nr:site-2 protease family protein [Chlamydiales bacterium]
MLSLFYLILAASALGFLIFIHELGHYWMARREGMKVEAFSIGFGKPIYSWERDGVKWQFCWLPFGGYVRIAGMEKKGRLEPHEIAEGFYGKSPLSRIKVALMGPIVNIVFALFAFTCIWMTGGRLKPFSEYTQILGYVDPSSSLYAEGIRPGDQIEQLNGKPFKSFNDFLYSAISNSSSMRIEGEHRDYFQNSKNPFSYAFQFQEGEEGIRKIQSLFSKIAPADYLICAGALPPDSPMQGSGVEVGDRIVWVDGESIFSQSQLVSTVNAPKVLITVQRGDTIFVAQAPRIRVGDLRIDQGIKAELEDWQHEAHIEGKFSQLYYLPYDLNTEGVIQGPIIYLDENSEEKTPSVRDIRSHQVFELQPGDRILAVDGMKTPFSYELLKQLQTRHIQILVQREKNRSVISWQDADKALTKDIDWQGVAQMVSSIGTDHLVQDVGDLKLLNPVEPKPILGFSHPKDRYTKAFTEREKEIQEIEDPLEKERAVKSFEKERDRLKLGIQLQNLQVAYNPNPIEQFTGVIKEVYRTLSSLLTGKVSPKWMSGPVGIVQVMHHGWMVSFKEALFWMGMISLNLGIINLLPIPVLDGGHICFSLWESITKKRISSKTMERLVLPFVMLLIVFFVYLTYHDLARLFHRFF